MDLGLRGKVAVVTAASGGLARAIAEEFAAEGAITVIAARNEARLKTAADEIAHKTGGTQAYRVVRKASELGSRSRCS